MKPAGQNKRTTVIGSKVKVNKEVKEKRTKSRQSNAKTSRKNPKTSGLFSYSIIVIIIIILLYCFAFVKFRFRKTNFFMNSETDKVDIYR